MLDLPRLERIRLRGRPPGQRLVATAFLAPNYRWLPGVRIELEGLDRLPREPVLFAMNHTDRYNYWPFQYELRRSLGRFTATWVKGKYYQNRWLGKFMELTNNIPTVSRGYLISRDFLDTVGRRPTPEEYQALRSLVEGGARDLGAESEPPRVPDEVLTRARNILGRPFDPTRETYAQAIDALFRAMTKRFVALNAEAFAEGLDVLVFPQGTRSLRLSRGHTGLAQIALHLQRTIVPVGCSGSDRVYPAGSPWARAGRIVYRIGEPLRFDRELAPFHAPERFEPFTPEAESRHRERFERLIELVMGRIDELVDEPYRFAPDEAPARRDAGRFV